MNGPSPLDAALSRQPGAAAALRPWRRLAWFAAGAVSYALFHLAAKHPALAEPIAGSAALHVPSWLLSLGTSWIPIPVVEWVYVLIAAFVLGWTIRGVRALRRGERSAAHLAADAALWVAAGAGTVVLLFYLMMGHYFARPPLKERLGLSLPDSVSVGELTSVVRELADSANAARLRLRSGPPDSLPLALTPERRQQIVVALAQAWPRAVQEYGLDPALGWPHGRPKAPLFASWFYEHRLPGQYVFFTGEVLLARGNPILQWAKTIVHEQAHQRGVAHEGDANVLAFLVGRVTDDDAVRYAVHTFAFEQLFGPLYRTAPDSARSVIRHLSAGVFADIRERNRYFAAGEGRLATVATRVNDAYLRTQRVPDGIASYGHSAELILAVQLATRHRATSGQVR